MPIFALIYSI